jgi:FkbM family methyltransferase
MIEPWDSLKRIPDGSFEYLMKSLVRMDEYRINKIDWEPKWILDIGSNIGIFSIMSRLKFGEGVRIIGVEGNNELLEVLTDNCSKYGIEVIGKAISSHSGYGVKVVSRSEQRIHSLCESCSGGIGETIEIGDLIRDLEIDIREDGIMKIDCEGCEDYLINRVDILSKVKMLSIEFHNMREGSDLIAEKFVSEMDKTHTREGKYRVRRGKGKVCRFFRKDSHVA